MHAEPKARWRRAVVLVPVLIGVLAFGLRIAQLGGTTLTTDEAFWLVRTDGFTHALAEGDLARATAEGHVPDWDTSTMPGVTTMWAASAGIGLAHTGAALGFNDEIDGPWVQSATALAGGRVGIAATASVLIGLVVALGWALFGRVAATVAGVLLATEPWFIGLSTVIHTDAFVTLFGAVSMLTLALALGLHHPAPPGRRTAGLATPPVRLLLCSGVFAGLAILSKLSALALVIPGAMILVLIESLSAKGPPRHRTRITESPLVRHWVRLTLWWSVGAIVVFVVLWPAIWVDPLGRLRELSDSAGLARQGHSQFYWGEETSSPGISYYPVAWAFRMAPWTLLGAVGVVTAGLVQAARWCAARFGGRIGAPAPPGLFPLWLVLVTAPYFLVITFSEKTFDRYVIPLYPYLALAIGLAVAAAMPVVRRRLRVERVPRPLITVTAVVLTGTLATVSLVQAPYAISYTNPILGGQQAAQDMILLGWGEGRSVMGASVARREAGNCDAVVVAMVGVDSTMLVPCGRAVPIEDWLDVPRAGDYLVTSINLHQRLGPELVLVDEALKLALVDEFRIDGVPYTYLWQVVPKDAEGGDESGNDPGTGSPGLANP